MAKFIIQPHGRLQEWIAHEKGYFRDEGLDYEFARAVGRHRQAGRRGRQGDRPQVRRVQSYEKGGGNKACKSDISCACHWTVNQAATQQYRHDVGQVLCRDARRHHGAAGIADQPAGEPGGQEIAVGYHSGSHYTTIQALEPFLQREEIKLRFGGSIWARVDIAVGRDLPAVSVWGLSFQGWSSSASARSSTASS